MLRCQSFGFQGARVFGLEDLRFDGVWECLCCLKCGAADGVENL